MENALRRAFNATMFNLSCYMNLSYQESPPDPHIHWWIVPRYDHPVSIAAMTFEDPRFGNPYDHAVWLDVSDEIRLQIVERLRHAIAE
jgi:diadenosine tetraphosphate (Ap4A) HIT family hydrolase